MRRKLIAIFVAGVCIFSFSMLISATEVNPYYAAGTYFNQESQTNLQGTATSEAIEAAAVYNGEEISQQVIEFQRNMNVLRDASTASEYQTDQDIINNIVKSMIMLEEAERQGLAATQEEIDELMDNAYLAYDIPEGKAMIDAYCDGAGLTTEEYFSLLKEQAPRTIARQKLLDAVGKAYCDENGLTFTKVNPPDEMIAAQETYINNLFELNQDKIIYFNN